MSRNMTRDLTEGRPLKQIVSFALPLLFGVPLFIFCGFPHSIADAFYTLATPFSFLGEHAGAVALYYIAIVLGNFIGCNLTRFVLWDIKA